VVRWGIQKFSSSCRILSANIPIETLSSEVGDILQRDTVSRVRETVRVAWYTRSRSLPSDQRDSSPAHYCNLNYKDSHCISVVFHNLSGYDPLFIIKEIVIIYKGQLELLSITKEKYISFTKNIQNTADNGKNSVKLQFIDLYKFFNISLDKLASFLNKDKLLYCNANFLHYPQKILMFWRKKVYFRMSTLTALKSWRGRVYHHANRFTVCWYRVRMRLRARRQHVAAILYPNARRVQWSLS